MHKICKQKISESLTITHKKSFATRIKAPILTLRSLKFPLPQKKLLKNIPIKNSVDSKKVCEDFEPLKSSKATPNQEFLQRFDVRSIMVKLLGRAKRLNEALKLAEDYRQARWDVNRWQNDGLWWFNNGLIWFNGIYSMI